MLAKLTLRTLLLAFAVPSSLAQEFAIADRAAGTVTRLGLDGTFLGTVNLPAGTQAPEPMYVVAVADEVVVGDRANDRIVRFDSATYTVQGFVDVGAGVFHMWAADGQLWVNNDVDNTTSVIDTATWQVLGTITIPAEFVAQGYKPHDVFVGGGRGYISLIAGSGATDFVLQYEAATLGFLRRVSVSKDPHLWLDGMTNTLYVATQGGNVVTALDGEGLTTIDTLPLPGAHGIFLPSGTRTLLVTNITSMGGAGTDSLYAVRLAQDGTFASVEARSAPFGTSHNIAASPFGTAICTTHSGATADQASFFSFTPQFDFVTNSTTGTNPFGLAYVP